MMWHQGRNWKSTYYMGDKQLYNICIAYTNAVHIKQGCRGRFHKPGSTRCPYMQLLFCQQRMKLHVLTALDKSVSGTQSGSLVFSRCQSYSWAPQFCCILNSTLTEEVSIATYQGTTSYQQCWMLKVVEHRLLTKVSGYCQYLGLVLVV